MDVKFCVLFLGLSALLKTDPASGQEGKQTTVRFRLKSRDVRPDAGTRHIDASLQSSVRACAVQCSKTPKCQSYAMTSPDGATGSRTCHLYDVASDCVTSYLPSAATVYYSRVEPEPCPTTTVPTTKITTFTTTTTTQRKRKDD